MNESVPVRGRRVLSVGFAAAASEVATEATMMLIVMEPDPASAEAARRRYAHLGERAIIIGGDPRRMLYKLSGPFDAIFYEPAYDSILEPLTRLLAPGGVMTAVSGR